MRTNPNRFHSSPWPTVALLCTLAAALPAQKVALGGDHGDSMVQLLDCSRLTGVSIDGLARIVQSFGDPALAPANVRALGTSHIAVLGSPQQCAGAERLFAQAIEHAGAAALVDCKVLQIPAGVFAKFVQPLLLPGAGAAGAVEAIAPNRTTLSSTAVRRLLGQLDGLEGFAMQTPKVVVPLLQEAAIRVGQERHYTADYAAIPASGNGAARAMEAVDRMAFDGSQVAVVVARRGDGESIVLVRAEHSEFPPELPEVEVETAPGVRSKIQVPCGRGCTIDVCAAVRDREVLLTFAPCGGRMMCVLVEVVVAKSAR